MMLVKIDETLWVDPTELTAVCADWRRAEEANVDGTITEVINFVTIISLRHDDSEYTTQKTVEEVATIIKTAIIEAQAWE